MLVVFLYWSPLEVVILRLIINVAGFIVSVPPSDVERLEKVAGGVTEIIQGGPVNTKGVGKKSTYFCHVMRK